MNDNDRSKYRAIIKSLEVPIIIFPLLFHVGCATAPNNVDDQNRYKITQTVIVPTSQELDTRSIEPSTGVSAVNFTSCSKEAMEFSLHCIGGDDIAVFCTAVIATRIGLCGVSSLIDSLLNEH